MQPALQRSSGGVGWFSFTYLYAESQVGESLGYQEEKDDSLRPSIDLLYDIEQTINPSRLTKALAQFG